MLVPLPAVPIHGRHPRHCYLRIPVLVQLLFSIVLQLKVLHCIVFELKGMLVCCHSGLRRRGLRLQGQVHLVVAAETCGSPVIGLSLGAEHVTGFS